MVRKLDETTVTPNGPAIKCRLWCPP